jgi:SSS family solute:Na+ symporter
MLYATAVMLNVLLDLNPKVLIVAHDQVVFDEIQSRVGAKDYQFFFAAPEDDIETLVRKEEPNIVLVEDSIAGQSPVWMGLNELASEGPSPMLIFTPAGEDEAGAIFVEGGGRSIEDAVPAVERPPRWHLIYSIILMGAVIGLYTFFGGLTAVVYTDVIQCAVMLVGCFFTLFYGIYKLGGVGEFVGMIGALGERTRDHFNLILPADTATPYPWSGIFLGLGMVLASAYWIGNQSIVQRSLAARSEGEAKASYLWGALLKVLIPFSVVIPGIIALAHNPNVGDADKAMAVLIRDIMPPGLLGIFFGAFLAALMSSVDSCLNSAATLWTKDIYQRYFKPDANDRHLLVVGRILTLVFIVWGILFGRFSARFESIYTLIQTLLTLFQGPSLAIIILGVLWKRTTGAGALVGLLSGLLCSGGMLFINAYASTPLFQIDDPFLYIAWWSFVFSLAITAGVSLLTPMEPEEKLRGLVYRYDKKAEAQQQEDAA